MSGIAQALVGAYVRAPYTVQFLNSYSSATDASSYSFSSVDFGDEGGTREVFVQVVATTSATRAVSSLTIGGVSATLATSSPSSSSSTQTMAFAAIPTGTSGTVSVTFNGTCTACWIAVYRVESRPGFGTNHSSYNSVAATSGTSNSLGSVVVPANGFLLGNMLITSGTVTGISSATYTLAGGVFVESNYRASLLYSRIGLTTITPTNTVSWTGSAAHRQTAWAYS